MGKQVEVFTLDAFAKGEHGGNPAGVVLQADDLFEEEMQQTASIIGFSETAFLLASAVGDFRARYFTPNSEVDLCGHATIAAFSVMVQEKQMETGSYRLETKAGLLEVVVRENGDIFLSQAMPQFCEEADKQEIAASLGISPDAFMNDLPLQIVSTGLRDIMVPVRSKEILHAIQPDMERIKELSTKYQVVGYHVFTLETESEALASCRNFAPLYDIPEESATGTSTGALLCYLYTYGKYTASDQSEVIFEQGETMGQPSLLKANMRLDSDNKVIEVQVGGSTANVERKLITLPN